MGKASKKFNYSKNDKLFREVFRAIASELPNGINKGRNNTPLNLYEAVSVGAAKVYLEKGYINTKNLADWINDEELIKYTTGATNTKSFVLKRIQYCEERFGR